MVLYDPPPHVSSTSHRVVVGVDGIAVSGLLAEANDPAAVIVALHGGATHSSYFDTPEHPRNSLLRLGRDLGFTVFAPDRLGYGSSSQLSAAAVSAEYQVRAAFEAVDRALEGRPRGAGTFVVGHSQGCVLALRMATSNEGRDLLGLELSGTGLRRRSTPPPGLDAATLAERPLDALWSPSSLYPLQDRIKHRAADYDAVDASTWPQEFGELSSRVSIPVRYTVGDHETWWRPGQEGLDDVRHLFSSAPRVVLDEQWSGAHNLSLGRSARAYHLRILAFVEECILGRAMSIDNNKEMESQHAHI